jgi:plasmid maintenance system killer protein
LKTIRVVITGSAKKEFESLHNAVKEEVLKGITNSPKQSLLNSIKQKIEILKENPQYGVHIQKKKIPKYYLNNYDVNNLWKINLCGAWRMIYTLKGSEVEIITLILDIFKHKDYDKRFSYRGK